MTLFALPPPLASGKVKRPYAEMLAYAQRWVALLRPACTRIEIAGSVRRRTHECGDIEIVVIEKFPGAVRGEIWRLLTSYFSTWGTRKDVWRVDGVKQLSFYDRSLDPPLQIDIFLTRAEYWGWTYFVRTGSHEWNLAVMSHLNRIGIRTEHNVHFHKLKPPTQSAEEQDVFDLIGMPFVPPERRVSELAFNQLHPRP